MGRKPTIQSKLEITSMSGCCDEIVEFHYSEAFKKWEAMCPKCKLNLWIDIKTPSIRFKSLDKLHLKECQSCGKKWMQSHTCNAPDVPTIIQAMQSKDMIIYVEN